MREAETPQTQAPPSMTWKPPVSARLPLRIGARLLAISLLVACSLSSASAQAAIGPKWRIDSTTNTTAAPNSELTYTVQLTNVGDESIPASPGGNSQNCVAGALPPADPPSATGSSLASPPV